MRYNQPFGNPDENAAYVDRNTAGAVKGSVPPAAAVEHPQREIVAVIVSAGLTPSGDDLTQLDQAIDQKIAAATGGGDTSNFVTMTIARGRLPIFPDILTADGKIPVISPGVGVLRVPAGYSFVHRGIFAVTTVSQDFVTAANKTYHLRWNPTDGFALKDVADAVYNPTAKPETDIAFDSAYDDMLVARAVTSAGNVLTVTPLVNKAQIHAEFEAQIIDPTYEQDASPSTLHSSPMPVTLNFGRRPLVMLTGFTDVTAQTPSAAPAGDAEINVAVQCKDRYQAKLYYQRTVLPSGAVVAGAAII